MYSVELFIKNKSKGKKKPTRVLRRGQMNKAGRSRHKGLAGSVEIAFPVMR